MSVLRPPGPRTAAPLRGTAGRSARLAVHRPVVVLLAALALMVVAWSVTTPLGTAADEPEHYTKTLAAGRGDLRGHPPQGDPIDAVAATLERQGGAGSHADRLRAVRWVAAGARSFSLPARLVPTAIGCFDSLFQRADTAVPARCKVELSSAPGERRFESYEAVNPPYLYVAPGVATRLAGDANPVRAYRLGRAAMGAMCLILLGLAFLLVWDREAGPLSLAGAMVATTPAGVWSFSVLNPSGLEISGAMCWTAALLRLLRGPRRPVWVWAAAAAGGVALATARSSGPLFVVLVPVCLALLFGPRALWAVARRAGRPGLLVVASLGLALAAAAIWLRYIPRYPLGLGILDHVGPALAGMPRTLRESVGRFAGDFFVPVAVAAGWAALLTALVVAAAIVATPRQRLRLALVVAALAAFTVAYAAVFLTNGFPEFYGRYALPALVVLPLSAGAVLVERRAQMAVAARRRLMVGLAGGTAAIQVLAWWLESRRLAVGTDGPVWFLGDAAWEPPWGWLPWALAMLAAGVAYASVAVLPWRRRTPAG